MLASSNADVSPGQIETQQLRIMAPVEVRVLYFAFAVRIVLISFILLFLVRRREQSQVRLRLRIAYTVGGVAKTDQTDFSFPVGLMSS